MSIPEEQPVSEGEYEDGGGRFTGVRGLAVAVGLLLVIAVAAIAYSVHERRMARQLTDMNVQTSDALSQTRSEVADLTNRLNALTTPQLQPAPVLTEKAPVHHRRHHTRLTRAQTPAPWKKLEQQLSEQQDEIAKTNSALDQTRQDLEGKISSTRSDLHGSIARNHAELVALEKRGERNYVEFDLTKSKQFAREGPISLALRHTNTRHKFYNVDMIVDDYKLSKKHVNLYEPVTFAVSDYTQPVELVVNQISKNHVHGYVSSPKYTKAELTPEQQSGTSPSARNGAASPSGATAAVAGLAPTSNNSSQ